MAALFPGIEIADGAASRHCLGRDRPGGEEQGPARLVFLRAMADQSHGTDRLGIVFDILLSLSL